MRRIYLFLLFAVCSIGDLSAADGDTTSVYVHQSVDMTWYGNYDRQGVFPNDPQKQYRKILMRYTMGCATGGCSDWDYTTQIFLMRPTGVQDSSIVSLDTVSMVPLVVDTVWNVFEVQEPLELGRVITPYGSMLSNNWTREFVFDVTDFVLLLRDTVNIRAFYSGWSSGFSVSLRFDFIEGTPPREVLGVYNVYKGDGTYSNSANFEANFFHAKTLQLPGSGIAGGRLFSTITGHGFDNNVYCAEFCERTYTPKINGTALPAASVWRDDCGSNPLFPQGGTWLYDRAGWCPGERALTHEWEVGQLLQGGNNTLDFDMQVYTWSGNQAPSYTVDSRLVLYGNIHFANDANLLEIVAPTTEYQHKRINPICANPVVRVQNTGSNPLTSLRLQYQVAGAPECEYTWTGNLAFLQTAQIELPALNWENADTLNPRFSVEIVGVNGGSDQYAANNRLSSAFAFPPRHNFDTMYIELKTNNYGTETGYRLLDADGNIVHQRIANTLSPGTTYLDKIYFPKGCYVLDVQDSGKDGLSFWADPGAGSGDVQIKRHNAQIGVYLPIVDFGADFGTFIRYAFIAGTSRHQIDDNLTTGCTLSPVSAFAQTAFSATLFPNPASGLCFLRLELDKEQVVDFQVFNAVGQVVQAGKLQAQAGEGVYDLTLPPSLAPGMYLVRLQAPGIHWTQPLILEGR